MIQAKKMIDYPNDQVQQATPQTKAETSKSKRNNHSLLLKDDRGRKDNTPRLGSK